MKVYISGPITGTDDYKERFCAAEKRIREAGGVPINPVRLNEVLPEEDGYTHDDYLTVDLAMVSLCDAILMLDGWRASRGARLEYKQAGELGKKIILPGSRYGMQQEAEETEVAEP